MAECIQTFMATDEEGQDYRIHVLQEYVNAGTRGDPSQRAPGLKRLVTDDGFTVNRRDKGRYTVLAFDGQIEVCSDDPDAP